MNGRIAINVTSKKFLGGQEWQPIELVPSTFLSKLDWIRDSFDPGPHMAGRKPFKELAAS